MFEPSEGDGKMCTKDGGTRDVDRGPYMIDTCDEDRRGR
jgi:hypothetical protein